MRTRFIIFLTAFYLVSTLVGCAAKQAPMPSDPVPDADTLFALVQERSEQVQSARARAVMEYFGKGGRVRVRQAVVVQKPGNLRIETLSPFDSTLSVVVANEDEMTFYDLQNEVAYTGRPTGENLAKLVPIWMEPSDIVNVLLGGAPLARIDPDRQYWKMAWDGRANAWRMFVRSDFGGQLELLFRHGTWTLAGARETDKKGTLIWEVRTADFRLVSDGERQSEVPTRVRFLMPRENVDVSLNVSDYQMNPELDELLFELFTPDVELFQLDGMRVTH